MKSTERNFLTDILQQNLQLHPIWTGTTSRRGSTPLPIIHLQHTPCSTFDTGVKKCQERIPFFPLLIHHLQANQRTSNIVKNKRRQVVSERATPGNPRRSCTHGVVVVGERVVDE